MYPMRSLMDTHPKRMCSCCTSVGRIREAHMHTQTDTSKGRPMLGCWFVCVCVCVSVCVSVCVCVCVCVLCARVC